MTSRAVWLGLGGAALLALLLSPATAGAATPPGLVPPEPPEPDPDDPDHIEPPPATGGYAPDPLLGGGSRQPGAPAAPVPMPARPALGPIYPTPAGAYPIVQDGRYRADLEIDAPAFLVNEGIVASKLTAAGFTVHRCTRTTGSHFQVEATRTGTGGSFAPPERVTVKRLERIR